MPQMASGASMAAKSSMLYLATSSTSDSDLESSSSSDKNRQSSDEERSSGDDSDDDGGEFRPPPGAMRTLRKTQRMSLRSSPRKNAPPLPPQQQQQPPKRGRPPLAKLKKQQQKRGEEILMNGHQGGAWSPSSSKTGPSTSNKISSKSPSFSPRQSPRKRCPATASSSSFLNASSLLPDDLPASAKIEVDPPSSPAHSLPSMDKKPQMAAKLSSPKRPMSPNLSLRKICTSPSEMKGMGGKKSPESMKIKNGSSPSKMFLLMAAKRRRRRRADLVRQNAILPGKRMKKEGIGEKMAKLGKMAGRSAKMAALVQMRTASPKKEKKYGMRVKKEEEGGIGSSEEERISFSDENEEEDEEEEEEEEIDDDDLFTIGHGKVGEGDSSEEEEEEMDEGEEEEMDEEGEEESSEEEEEKPIFKSKQFCRPRHHRQNCTASEGYLREKAAKCKEILETKPEPKKRGRKPANKNQNGQMALEGQNIVGNAGRKRTSGGSSTPMSSSAAFNDFSNPFDAENGEQQDGQQIDAYRRKMRDLVDLDRYLGQPDRRRGFSSRPVHRPFLLRNLFYMQKQRPMSNKKPCSMVGDLAGLKQQRLLTIRPDSRQMVGGSRTGSRASNKMPATIKFTLIRNNNCFGHKSAIVQCFHMTELNGRLSQLKRIPSATFEKPVNDKINTCIDIDMLEECQPNNVLLDTKSNRSEHFVVRVVFRFEDAEIGGRHLRKVPSRQLSGGFDHQNVQQQNDYPHKNLRKNGALEPNEVVMFGAVRIFSHTPERGLNAVVGETFILLHTAAELHVDDLNTKSSAGQIARLLNCESKKNSICVPFIRIVVLNEEEEDEDEEEEENDDLEGNNEEGGMSARLARERLMEELAEMEETATASMLGTRRNGNGGANGPNGLGQFGLLDEPLPERIAIKFLLQPPPPSNSSIPPFQPLFLHSFQPNGHCGGGHQQHQQNTGQPGMKRAKLLRLSDSSADEQTNGAMDVDLADSSMDDEELAMRAQFGMLNGFDLAALEPKREFALRIISPKQCFLCRANLKIRNLWTLLKHLRFVHPRFQFTFEPSIPLNGAIAGGPSTLPGFSLSLNNRFDASFELRSSRFASSMPLLGSQFDNGPSSSRKRQFQSRPTWLVTRVLAEKMRTNEDFPIERFTAISQQQWGEYEYLLSMGRFDFGTPARMDQQWLIQTGSRKLEDITDLHPAEKLMMQMWNGFLPRARLTMLGHKLTYAAVRIFVHHHWRQIGQLKLRTHFLLHLTTLLNANAIDEDERYDLVMRLDGPAYWAGQDSGHWVNRELTQLERERQNGGGGAAQTQGVQQFQQQNESTKRQQTQNNQREQRTNSGAGNAPGSPGPKKHHHQSPPSSSSILPHQPIAPNHFTSLAQLRARYPFAGGKRLVQIWKFLRHYDFPDFALISSTVDAAAAASNGISSQIPQPPQFLPPTLPRLHQSFGGGASGSIGSSSSSGFFSSNSNSTTNSSKNSSAKSSSSSSSLASSSNSSSSSSSNSTNSSCSTSKSSTTLKFGGGRH